MIYKLIFFDDSYKELLGNFGKGVECDFGRVEGLIMEIIGYKKNEGDMNKAPKKTDGASYQHDSFTGQYLTQCSSFMKNSYFKSSENRTSGTGSNGVGSGRFKKGDPEKSNRGLTFASSISSLGLNPVRIGP